MKLDKLLVTSLICFVGVIIMLSAAMVSFHPSASKPKYLYGTYLSVKHDFYGNCVFEVADYRGGSIYVGWLKCDTGLYKSVILDFVRDTNVSVIGVTKK